VKEDVSSVVDGALVIIFADDTYGTTVQSIGGNSAQRESIVFVGYIIDGSIDYDYKTSTVHFDVGSPTEIMKVGEAFSVSVEDSDNPTADASAKGGDPWFYLVGLTTKTALYHYYHWHSTVVSLLDIRYVGDEFNLQYFDADRGSLYDAGNTLLKSAIYGAAVCDRQGALYFEIDAGAINNAQANLNQSMFIDNHDWMGTPSIEEQQTQEVSYLEAGGVAYYSTTGTFSAMLAAAPGETPAYRGKNLKLSGFALTTQGQLNTLVGNIWENMNATYPEVSLDLVGNFRNLDIAPQEVITMTLDAEDTFRGISWEQKAFTPRAMSWSYDAEKSLFLPSVNLKEITQGNAGETIAIPVSPPDGGYDVPPIQVPPVIPPIPVPPVDWGAGGIDYFYPAHGYNGTDLREEDYDSNLGILWEEGDISYAYGAYRIPATWGGSSITFRLNLAVQAGRSGDVGIYWQIERFRCGTIRADLTTFIKYWAVTDGGIPSGYWANCVAPETYTSAQVQAGDTLSFSVTRFGTLVGDTAGDVHVIAVEVTL
jgi:hypothetical protein